MAASPECGFNHQKLDLNQARGQYSWQEFGFNVVLISCGGEEGGLPQGGAKRILESSAVATFASTVAVISRLAAALAWCLALATHS
jgi:hypothetical protein